MVTKVDSVALLAFVSVILGSILTEVGGFSGCVRERERIEALAPCLSTWTEGLLSLWASVDNLF